MKIVKKYSKKWKKVLKIKKSRTIIFLKKDTNKGEIYMKNKGITLIALTVTVIVLLIISGVTISYLTGENGIINQAKDSKKFAGAVEEKEVLNTSVAAAIGKSSNSKIDEVNLKKYLNQNVGDEVKDYTLEKKDGSNFKYGVFWYSSISCTVPFSHTAYSFPVAVNVTL